MIYIGNPGNNAGIISLNFFALHLLSRADQLARRPSHHWSGRSGGVPYRRRACHVIFIITTT